MIPDQDVEKPGSEIEHGYWRICPICKEPNPAESLHCRYCWGASLQRVKPVDSVQLAEYTARRQKQLRRWRLARTLIISIGATALLLGTAVFYLYNFTDIAFAPPAFLSSNSSQGNWAMYRHDTSRTGSSDAGAVLPKGTLKWTYQTGAQTVSSPTVVGGVAYFGSRDHIFYAVDINTGKEKWTFEAGSWFESSPTVVDGVIYVGNNDGFIYALDAATGKELWRFETLYAVKSTAAVADNAVYFGADDYNVYSLDKKTGKMIWKFATGSQVGSSPVISNGILYVGSNDMFCYALNAQTGKFRLKVQAYEVISSPAVADSKVYFTSRSYLYVMNGKARNWPYELELRPWWIQFYALNLAPPPPPRSGVMWGLRLAYGTSNTTPILSGNKLFTTGDNKVYRLDLGTHKFDWTFTANRTINSSPALANGVIYVGSDDGTLYAIDAESGKKLWSYRTGDTILSSPTVVDGVVYVTSLDGKLYAIQ